MRPIITFAKYHKKFFLVLGILTIGVLIQSCLFINGDIVWLIHCGKLFLSGGKYFHDFFEVNPPMCIYIYLPVIFLRKLTTFSESINLKIYIFSIIIFSLIFSNYFIQKIKIITNDQQEIKTLNLILPVLAFAFAIQPGHEFGQREVIIVIFIMPYLLLMTLRTLSLSTNTPTKMPPTPSLHAINFPTTSFISAVLAGLFAGIGFSIKPYFLFAFFGVEFYFLFQERKLFSWCRTECITLLLVIIFYILSIALWTPEYVTQVLPRIWRFYYLIYATPLPTMIFSFISYVFAAAFFSYFLIRKSKKHTALFDILAIVSALFYVGYLLQQTSWYYHALPPLIISTLLLVLLFSELLPRIKTLSLQEKAKSFKVIFLSYLTGILILYPIFATAHDIYFGFAVQENKNIKQVIDFIKKNAKNKSIYFLSDSMTIATYINSGHSHFSSRFPCLWLIDSIEFIEQSYLHKNVSLYEKTQKEKNFFTDAVTNDLVKYKPTYIFVRTHQERSYYKTIAINYLKFFLENPKFAQLWHNYYFVKKMSYYDLYKSYS